MEPTIAETRPAARLRLAQERAEHAGHPKETPKALPVSAIEEEPLVFQPRAGMYDDHAQEILAGIRRGTATEPLDVWWTGRRWVLMDGHHRLAAYRALGEKTEGPLKVPVRCHDQLSLDEAHALSLTQNSRDKKNMTREEKTGAAWALVCIGGRTKKEQAALSSVAPRTIASMRSVFKTMTDRGIAGDILEAMGWDRARAMERGDPEADYSQDAKEAWAQEWAGRLDRALSGLAIENPDVLARALQIWSAELPSNLIQQEAFWEALDGAGRGLLEEADSGGQLEADGVEDF